MASRSGMELYIVDNDAAVSDSLEKALAQPGLNITGFANSISAWDAIQEFPPDIMVLEKSLPDSDGMELLNSILAFDPGIFVVMLSSDSAIESVVEAIRNGACDYLTKPVCMGTFRAKVDALIGTVNERRSPRSEKWPADAGSYGTLFGGSAPMLDVFGRMQRIAPHFQSVLVTGATGTGKERVARALHQMSPLKGKPLVVCNCAAIPDTLFESELFGHVRGSFTGATQDRAGFFEAADGGVLFLAEIGEVPLKMQAKFLRALQHGEVQRVGSSVNRRVNVRVIAATNRNLRQMVQAGDFREDLFFRLAMLEIKLPSLAERSEDLPLLSKHFVEQFARRMDKDVKGLSRRAQMSLARYSWPGNIRELESAIGHGCMMTDTDVIDIGDLPEYIVARNGSRERQDRLTLEEVESRHVRYILDEAGGNKQLAADILGISRATLYRILSAKENDSKLREIA